MRTPSAAAPGRRDQQVPDELLYLPLTLGRRWKRIGSAVMSRTFMRRFIEGRILEHHLHLAARGDARRSFPGGEINPRTILPVSGG